MAPKQAQKSWWRLFVLVLAVLAGSSAHAQTAKRTAPITKEPLIVSIPADVVKLDPPAPSDGVSLLVVAHLYDRLLEFDATSTEVKPSLAESWEVSPDGLRYTFKLRKDATFWDGTPVNAEAVKFTFERVADKNHPQHFPGMAYAEDLLGDWFKGIETPDEHTAVFVLNRPFVPLLLHLATAPASIVSPAYWRETGETVVEKPMGSGPFKLAEWKRGAYVKVTARPDHWRGSPASETVFFQVQPEPAMAFGALRKGSTHLVVTLKPQVIPDRSEAALGQARIMEAPIPSLGYLLLNVKKPNLTDKRVRQAMNWAIDRDSICNVLLEGTSIPAKGPLPPGMLGHRENRPFSYGYDVEKAKALMTEAGYSAEKPLKLTLHCFEAARAYNTAGTRLAERLQEDFRKVFIDVEIKQMDFGGLIEMVNERTVHEAVTIGWMSDTGDPDNFLYYMFGNPSNHSNYANAEARELMEKAQGVQDPVERGKLYEKAEDIVIDEAPVVFINHAKAVKGVNRRLRGYKIHPVMVDRLFDVYLAKTESE